ncbi:hypothetical protein Taro_003973 [Colocasia esculenta]|uniref:Uncharacterized protein n=1 Tax=Colocasia esculenta TaxID=4460 RepID=A0A843TQE7_COLES|nr:hypothetical protein [Colocasia esculenta]
MTMTPPTSMVPLLLVVQCHTAANNRNNKRARLSKFSSCLGRAQEGEMGRGDEVGGFSSQALAHKLQREPLLFIEGLKDTSSGTPHHVMMTGDTSQGHLTMS